MGNYKASRKCRRTSQVLVLLCAGGGGAPDTLYAQDGIQRQRLERYHAQQVRRLEAEQQVDEKKSGWLSLPGRRTPDRKLHQQQSEQRALQRQQLREFESSRQRRAAEPSGFGRGSDYQWLQFRAQQNRQQLRFRQNRRSWPHNR